MKQPIKAAGRWSCLWIVWLEEVFRNITRITGGTSNSTTQGMLLAFWAQVHIVALSSPNVASKSRQAPSYPCSGDVLPDVDQSCGSSEGDICICPVSPAVYNLAEPLFSAESSTHLIKGGHFTAQLLILDLLNFQWRGIDISGAWFILS